jgi:hypothetical protein
MDEAVENKELLFKPNERRTRAESLAVLAARLKAHYKLKQKRTGRDIIRVLAEMVRDLNNQKGGTVALGDPERQALAAAQQAGPDPENHYGEDKKLQWLTGVIEKGKLTVTEKNRRKRVSELRTIAERLRDEKEDKRREKWQKQIRALYELANQVQKASVILETDLRDINRDSDRVQCTVFISTDEDNHPRGDMKKWLVLGQVNLRMDMYPMELKAYLPAGVTDFEHDSAWAMVLPLIGVKLNSLHYHTTEIEAYVAPRQLENFRVPWPGYNPMEEEDAEICTHGHCKKDPHPMVGMDRYTPYSDPTLYKAVEGRLVRIRIGPAPRGD